DHAARLVADRETVRLELDGCPCDYARLVAAAACEDLAALEVAGALRGEFAPGLNLRGCEEFEPGLAATREDVRQCRRKVWGKLVGLLAGEPERALPFARCIVEEDPLGEAGWVALIALLGAAGRSDEAEAQRAVAIRTLEGAGLPVP